MANNWREIVAAMTLTQRRERLAEIARLSQAGDYTWDFDEYVVLIQAVPEKAAALKAAFASRAKRAARHHQ